MDIKLISGDDPKTVEALARKAGFTSKSIDMSKVQDVETVVDSYSTFWTCDSRTKERTCFGIKEKK